MANTEDIEVQKGAYGYRLQFTLYDADGNARNCTGYTADLRYWTPGATQATSQDLTWVDADPSAGICYYDVQDGDFGTKGEYLYEIELEKDGVKDPGKTGRIIVIDRPTADAA